MGGGGTGALTKHRLFDLSKKSQQQVISITDHSIAIFCFRQVPIHHNPAGPILSVSERISARGTWRYLAGSTVKLQR